MKKMLQRLVYKTLVRCVLPGLFAAWQRSNQVSFKQGYTRDTRRREIAALLNDKYAVNTTMFKRIKYPD